MTALIDHAGFASAYRQLRPVERAFVDAVVIAMEQSANRANERISAALYKPLPDNITTNDERGMLEKPLVRAAIAERVNEIAAANELTVQRVVKELMAMAFSSIGDYQTIDDDGEILFDLTRCTPEQLSAVKQIRIEEPGGLDQGNGRRKCTIVLHDKIASIKMLAEFMGMLQPDNPHWNAQQAAPVTLRPGATTSEAANTYAALLGQ